MESLGKKRGDQKVPLVSLEAIEDNVLTHLIEQQVRFISLHP